MSNIIFDKLLPADNAVFTPGEELTLRAYMEKTARIFKIDFSDYGGPIQDYTFIQGQTFQDLINASEFGGKVCNVGGVLKPSNVFPYILVDYQFSDEWRADLRLNGSQVELIQTVQSDTVYKAHIPEE